MINRKIKDYSFYSDWIYLEMLGVEEVINVLSLDLIIELYFYCLEYVFRKRRGSDIVLVVERLR